MSDSKTFSPVSFNERELFMDALRGFAILGIFIANLSALSWYDRNDVSKGWHFPDFDKQMEFIQHMFIEGKFYSIFSLLFGWGLALQLKRTQGLDNSPKVNALVIRRLIFMFTLGFVHLVLIWNGDIVMFYSLVGFVLILFIRLSPKKLLILGIISILLPILLYWLRMQDPIFNKPADFLYSIGVDLDKRYLTASTPEEFKSLFMSGAPSAVSV